jgi:hypothetical protein
MGSTCCGEGVMSKLEARRIDLTHC